MRQHVPSGSTFRGTLALAATDVVYICAARGSIRGAVRPLFFGALGAYRGTSWSQRRHAPWIYGFASRIPARVRRKNFDGSDDKQNQPLMLERHGNAAAEKNRGDIKPFAADACWSWP